MGVTVRSALLLVFAGAAISACSSDGDPQADATTTTPASVATTVAPDRLPPPGRPLRLERTIDLPDQPGEHVSIASGLGFTGIGDHHVLMDGTELVDVTDPTAPIRTVAPPPGLDPGESGEVVSVGDSAVLAFADCPGIEVNYYERKEHIDDGRRWCSEVVRAFRVFELDVDAAAWVPLAELTTEDDDEYLGTDLWPRVTLTALGGDHLVVSLVSAEPHPIHWYEVDPDDGSVAPLYTGVVNYLRCEASDGRVLLNARYPDEPSSLAVAPSLGAPPQAYEPEGPDPILDCDADHIEGASPTVWRVRDQAGTLIRTWALPRGIVPDERGGSGGRSVLRQHSLDQASTDRSQDPHRGMVIDWSVVRTHPAPAEIHIRVFDGWMSEPLSIDPPTAPCCPAVHSTRLAGGTIVLLTFGAWPTCSGAANPCGKVDRTLHVIEPVDDAAPPTTIAAMSTTTPSTTVAP